MRHLRLFTCAMFLTSFLFSVSAVTETELWKQAEELMNQSKPESAIKVLKQLIELPESQISGSSKIKAKIWMFSQQSAIGEVDIDTQIADFKSMIQKSTNPTDKAVMQSMCAEMYANYYERNRNIIHGRSNISDSKSTSLGSITKNKLFDQFFQLLDASLKPFDLLKSNNA